MDARWRPLVVAIIALGSVCAGTPALNASHAAGQGGAGPIPPRFYVQAVGPRKIVFYCDLTANTLALCRSDSDWRTMENQQIVLGRHPGDPTRIKIGVFGTWETGLTWRELSRGVTIRGYTIQGHEWDHAKERR
ncbi:protein of unknown function [Magnetospirillum sp. XM-1]|nr:protein of unknown function [Magnetospirillum sp. XM-1]